MVTIKDIAKASGVAPSTVSYALNNDARIPEETRRKVLDAARQLGYRGRSGKKVEGAAKRHVILCLNSISGVIYSELAVAFKEVLKPSNCELLIYMGSDVNDIKCIDGAIILNSRIPNDSIRELVRRKIPVVVMDRNENIDGIVSITLDNEGGCYAVTKCALESGAKSFCFVSGPVTSFESKQRFGGFKKALAEYGISDYVQLPGDFTFESGQRAATYMLNQPLADAIVCANDEMAAGVAAGIEKAGLPQPILCGFDGIESNLKHKFFTAKASRADWGHNAAYTMLNLLDGTAVPANNTIPARLVRYD